MFVSLNSRFPVQTGTDLRRADAADVEMAEHRGCVKDPYALGFKFLQDKLPT